MDQQFDFCGWATKNDLLCSDGRVIKRDAFEHCDGMTVPLVWQHLRDNPGNVVGKALLKNRPEGVYVNGSFNNTEFGKMAKELVVHGDVTNLSIFANQLKQQGPNVVHGIIREVSLVYAGANPGAYIESVLAHEDGSDEEIILFPGEVSALSHSDDSKTPEKDEEESKEEVDKEAADSEEKKDEGDDEEKEDKVEHADSDSKETLGDIFKTLTPKQQEAVVEMIAQAIDPSQEESEEAEHSDDDSKDESIEHKEDHQMANVFEGKDKDQTLQHDAVDLGKIIADGRRYGTLKESMLAHGIENIDYLFPDAQNVTNTPQFISREMSWVSKVMNSVHHTPFSRIKSLFADITEDEARALGYIKGNLKKEEVFSLLKRTTTPQTIYKKQKLDRDDIIDITDFDVVAWLKSEMRVMLDEEIARAILIGDGRLASSDDKISEDHIRPIWTDQDLFTIKQDIGVSTGATEDEIAKATIRAALKGRINYKGSGNPTLFTTEDTVTNMLLLEDTTGRVIYESIDQLARAMRVSSIVTVEVMQGVTRPNDAGTGNFQLLGLIVNLADYNVGADKGGAVNMFDDFDIDYNAQKYLIETRISGALIRPFAAIALEMAVA